MRLNAISRLLSLVAAAVGVAAGAAEWTTSFPPEVLANKLDPAAKSMIVVSAGAASSGVREASAALAAGLRACGPRGSWSW